MSACWGCAVVAPSGREAIGVTHTRSGKHSVSRLLILQQQTFELASPRTIVDPISTAEQPFASSKNGSNQIDIDLTVAVMRMILL